MKGGEKMKENKNTIKKITKIETVKNSCCTCGSYK